MNTARLTTRYSPLSRFITHTIGCYTLTLYTALLTTRSSLLPSLLSRSLAGSQAAGRRTPRYTSTICKTKWWTIAFALLVLLLFSIQGPRTKVQNGVNYRTTRFPHKNCRISISTKTYGSFCPF